MKRHPTFIRYPRGPAEGVPIKEQPKLIDIGKAEIISELFQRRLAQSGSVPLGNMMSLARKVAVQLAAEDCDVAIINPRFVKPIDAGTTEFFGSTADIVVTFEDHVLQGGYGSAVLDCSMKNESPHPSSWLAGPTNSSNTPQTLTICAKSMA